MKRLLALLAVTGWLVSPQLADAQVPQTIVIDGVNDFDPSNLIDADGSDTEFSNLDMGNIYVTNDANFLYFGFEYDRGGWCDINLGLALDTRAGGGVVDPFARQVAWNTLASPPDFIIYDVIPTQCDGFNYETLDEWTAGTGPHNGWDVLTDGSNGLGIVDSGTFVEGKISLATLGLSPSDPVNLEFWVTQNGTTKGPLDAACSDAVQLSTPGGTTFDTGTAVEMTCYHAYTVQADVDTTPPTVLQANAIFAGGIDPAFSTDKVDILFSEPVDPATVIPGNFSGIVPAVTATVDGSNPSLVHLTVAGGYGVFSCTPTPGVVAYTVTNVEDLAGNAIVANGTDNVGQFATKRVRFEGDMSLFLLTNSNPPDSFYVEGSVAPLNFIPEDNSLGLAQGGGLYAVEVTFGIPDPDRDGLATVNLEYKWFHNTAGYEPRSNRQVVLSNATGTCDTLTVYWNDDEPGDVTAHPIDVCFSVDMSAFAPGPGDSVGVAGDQGPIAGFLPPGVLLADDGVFPDGTPGDDIYSGYIRFPIGTFKTVNYKFGLNSTLECFGQSNRDVFLNDAAFDTVGGANGPILLPTYTFDRCSVTNKAIDVIFRVSTSLLDQDTVSTVEIGGDALPLNFGAPLTLLDDGVSPDAVAGDNTYSIRVTFPDSSNFNVGFKYLVNGNFECFGDPNREVFLNDGLFSTSNPIVLPTVLWDVCNQSQTGVPDLPVLTPPISLSQNVPNPFSSRTAISFRADEPGRAILTIFDVSGRKVRTLLDRDVSAGEYIAHWSGQDDQGRAAPPGVYFYSLRVGADMETKRMVYLK